jgi:hypothetical protein
MWIRAMTKVVKQPSAKRTSLYTYMQNQAVIFMTKHLQRLSMSVYHLHLLTVCVAHLASPDQRAVFADTEDVLNMPHHSSQACTGAPAEDAMH